MNALQLISDQVGNVSDAGNDHLMYRLDMMYMTRLLMFGIVGLLVIINHAIRTVMLDRIIAKYGKW